MILKIVSGIPIHLAAENGHTEIFGVLVPKVENPNAPMPDGWTPIHLAARNGHTKNCQIIGA